MRHNNTKGRRTPSFILLILHYCSISHFLFFFFKQKTAYEIGTGDWSSDVCSSDLRKTVFRYEMSMKFATIWGGFGTDLVFEPIAKFPWGTPFAEFSKLWGSTARQRVSVGWRNLVCRFERWRVSIRHRFQKIWKRKNFFHPAVWHVFLVQKWPLHINSL